MSTRRDFLTRAAAATLLAKAATAPGSTAETKATAGTAAATTKPSGALQTYPVPHTDLVVTRLAYGNAMIGIDSNSPDFIAQSVPVIRAAYQQGITFFDTADVYGHGKSELALGQVLKDIPASRRRLVIQSKCSIGEGGVIAIRSDSNTGLFYLSAGVSLSLPK